MRLPRFRISLRTFLVSAAVIGLAIGLPVRRHLAQRAAEAQLVSSGFSVSFSPSKYIGRYWAREADREREEVMNSFAGSLKWVLLRHARLVDGQRYSPPPPNDRGEIHDEALAPLQRLRHVEALYCAIFT